MKKYILILLLISISLVGAIDCQGTYKADTEIGLIQTCDSCTYVNLSSISYPNGTTSNINKNMTRVGTTYNYTLPDSSQTGIIFFSALGDKNTILTEETLCIEITKTGTKLENSEAVIYLILVVAIFILFAISFYFMIAIPYSNEVALSGAVIQVTRLKYVKMFFFMLTWVLFVWFLNILIGLSNNFVALTMYYGFFGFMFENMTKLTLPIGIFLIVLGFFEIVRDANIQKNISKFGSAMR